MKKSKCREEQVAYALWPAESGTAVAGVAGTSASAKRRYGAGRRSLHTSGERVAADAIAGSRKCMVATSRRDLTLDKHLLSEGLRIERRTSTRRRARRGFSRPLGRACRTRVCSPSAAAQPGIEKVARRITSGGAGAAPIRLPSDAHRTATRGLAGQQEARATANSVGRPAAPHARQTAEAHGPAPMALHRGAVLVPAGPAQRWSMGCVHDPFIDVRSLRLLTVVDHWRSSESIIRVRFLADGQAHRERRRTPRLAHQTPAIPDSRSWHRIHVEGRGSVGLLPRRSTRFHAPWQTHRQPSHRILVRPLTRRMPQRVAMSLTQARETRHRSVAHRRLRAPTAWLPRCPDTVGVRCQTSGTTDRHQHLISTYDLFAYGTNVTVSTHMERPHPLRADPLGVLSQKRWTNILTPVLSKANGDR